MKIKFLFGSFLFATTKARCPEGYNEEEITGGFKCTDINECETGDHDCDKLTAKCVNTEGSYTCKCQEGKRLNIVVGNTPILWYWF